MNKPSDYFKKLDLAHLDANTAQFVRERILILPNIDIVEGTKEFETFKAIVEESFPRAIGIEPVIIEPIIEIVPEPIIEAVVEPIIDTKQEEIKTISGQVSEMTDLIDLLSELVAENPSDLDSLDVLELYKENLAELADKLKSLTEVITEAVSEVKDNIEEVKEVIKTDVVDTKGILTAPKKYKTEDGEEVLGYESDWNYGTKKHLGETVVYYVSNEENKNKYSVLSGILHKGEIVYSEDKTSNKEFENYSENVEDALKLAYELANDKEAVDKFENGGAISELKKGDVIIPYAFNKEFVVDRVFKNKDNETSFTGKFKGDKEEREFILNSKDKYLGKSEIEEYSTLAYKTKKSAEKSANQIKDYFGDRFLKSEVLQGEDERGNYGYQVHYELKKDKFEKGGAIKNYDLTVRTPKGLVTKKDFDGFSKDEIIKWGKDRDWIYNEKGEKLGGQSLNDYEFFVKEFKVKKANLPKKKFEKGGSIEDKNILVKLNFEGEKKPILFIKGNDGFYRGKSYETGKDYTYSYNVLKSFSENENKYVAVHESKDGYWTIASKPSSKEDAEAMLGGTPKNEIGKVVTLEEARAHKKTVGEEYLYEKGGSIGFIPMGLENDLAIISRRGGLKSVKDVIGILNAMIDSGLTDEDLKTPSTKTGFQYQKALDKKTTEILDKIEGNIGEYYKDGLKGNMPYSAIRLMVENKSNGKNLLKEFKTWRESQKFEHGGKISNEIVLNEGNGVVINKLYNKWQKIKTEKEHDAWSDLVKKTKFGTYGTIGIFEVLEKFEPKFPNDIIKRDFTNELKKALGVSKDAYVKFENGGEVVDNKHTYMMLGRLQMDNDYFLGNGNRGERNLWAGNVDGQIEEMKKLWNSLPENGKPEWLSMEDILDYERKMKGTPSDSDKDENIAKIRFNNHWKTVQLFIDGSLYGEFDDYQDAINQAKNNNSKIVLEDDVTMLNISSENPLSRQLSKITGDGWNDIDYENLDGSKNVSTIKPFKHIKSGKIFEVVNK